MYASSQVCSSLSILRHWHSMRSKANHHHIRVQGWTDQASWVSDNVEHAADYYSVDYIPLPLSDPENFLMEF